MRARSVMANLLSALVAVMPLPACAVTVGALGFSSTGAGGGTTMGASTAAGGAVGSAAGNAWGGASAGTGASGTTAWAATRHGAPMARPAIKRRAEVGSRRRTDAELYLILC